MATKAKTTKNNIAEIKQGDVFSESSHYVFKSKSGNKLTFNHLESGNNVTLGEDYVSGLLDTADQFSEEVRVGREDKLWTQKQIEDAIKKGELDKDTKIRVGDIRQEGIRSIWKNINSAQVFTVNFNKASKMMTKAELAKARQDQLDKAISTITKAQTAKKGVAKAAELAIKEIQDNPIQTTEKGEVRTLRGYKVQFESITGHYDVVDMDITTGMNRRQVNVNEINWLVIGNVRYIVER